MYVRLAFSVAAHLEPEILVVDEVLAVGDAEFQKKCLGKMEEVSKSHGRTVLLVSHNLGSIAQLCSSAILMQQGQLIMQGDVQSTLDKYLQSAASVSNSIQRSDDLDKQVYLKSVILTDIAGTEGYEFRYDEDIHVRMNIAQGKIKDDLSQYKILVTILDATKRKISSAEINISGTCLTLKIKSKFLTRGQYSISAIIYIPAIAQFDVIEDCCSFTVVDTGSEFYHLETFDYGVVFGNFSWE
jgi:lipopolysaccharide transport system ATP-binding protein